jgi:hypothetical protein
VEQAGSLAGESAASPCDAEILAREASAEEVGSSATPCCPDVVSVYASSPCRTPIPVSFDPSAIADPSRPVIAASWITHVSSDVSHVFVDRDSGEVG